MSMRQYARGIAHVNMQQRGVKQMNKPRSFGGKRLPSFFATNWREYAELKPLTAKGGAK